VLLHKTFISITISKLNDNGALYNLLLIGLELLGATYDVHLRLIGKGVVDFLLVLIELVC